MKKHSILFLLAGWAAYFGIRLTGPYAIAYWFSKKSFSLLNTLSLNQGPESLDFYLGRIQETVLGPVEQTLAFLLLAFMIGRYFRDVSLKVFAVIILIFLLMTKFDVLFFPPYGDAIGGPFAEGWWLFEHNFDYPGLFHASTYTVGGPRVYFFSIYPGFLALTLKLIPWTKVFLAFHHILTFALTAGIIAIFREYSRKVFEPVLAFLISLVLLALPLFQSQSEAINMEMPVAFFMVLCAYALVQKRWGTAVVYAVLAAAVKGIGIIACGSVAIVLSIVIFKTRGTKEKLRLLFLAVVSALVGAFIVGAKFLFHDAHVQQGMVRWDAGWPSLKNEFIFYLFLAACAVFVFELLRRIVCKQKIDILPSGIMFLFTSGWFLLFLNFYAVSPRYRVALYPFLVFFVVYAVTLVLQWKTFNRIIVMCVLVAACLLSYGGFYGTTSDNDHVLLERSLEYRNDLEVNRRLVKAAEERYSDALIVAPFTLAQALAIPQLGYVEKKLKVMIYGFSLQYGNIANYPGLKNLNLRRTVFIGVKIAPLSSDFSFPVGPHDSILEELAVGNKKVSFFMGGFAIETLWRVTHGISSK